MKQPENPWVRNPDQHRRMLHVWMSGVVARMYCVAKLVSLGLCFTEGFVSHCVRRRVWVADMRNAVASSVHECAHVAVGFTKRGVVQ